MADKKLKFRVHALQRMFERQITEEDVHQIVISGQTIENYPDDKPYPSKLLLGFIKSRPLHLVIAENIDVRETIIITVYEPDSSKWNADFKTRRKL